MSESAVEEKPKVATATATSSKSEGASLVAVTAESVGTT